MSSMVLVVGSFEEVVFNDLLSYVNQKYEKNYTEFEDALDFFREEESEHLYVDGRFYKVTINEEQIDDMFGMWVFEPETIPQDEKTFVCSYYNGGTHLHELIENWIRKNVQKMS